MKKLIAMLLAVMLVMSFCMVPAMAEAVALGETNLVMDLGDLDECELTDEDIEEGVILFLTNEEETLEIVVACYEADVTLEDLYAELEEEAKDEENGITAYGTTTINDVEACFETIADGEDNFILYYIVDGENMVMISVWYADEDAGSLSAEIIGTLELAK